MTAFYFKEYEKIANLVTDYLFERRWREVFLLVAGMTRTELVLRRMVIRTQQSVYECLKIKRLLCWAESIVIKTGTASEVASRRALVLFLCIDLVRVLAIGTEDIEVYLKGIRALVRDLTAALEPKFILVLSRDQATAANAARELELAFDSLDFTLKHIQALGALLIDLTPLRSTLDKLRQGKESAGSRRNIITTLQKLITSVLLELKLESGLHRFTQSEAAFLETYLTATSLIVDAKKAALTLTLSEWEGIAQRILRDEVP